MPQLRTAAALQVALLLSALPAQYLICRWTGSTATQRFDATTRYNGRLVPRPELTCGTMRVSQRVTGMQEMKRLMLLLRIWREWSASYLDAAAWTAWINWQMYRVLSPFGYKYEGPPTPQMIYVLTMMDDNDQGYFGASKTVRSPRPPHVLLHVGEVVLNKDHQTVGVVLSWDPELRAPPEWVEMVSDPEDRTIEITPHYKVLFTGPTPNSYSVAYLPQTKLEPFPAHRLMFAGTFPALEKYFTHFDGKRFVMQPWLRELFPEDQDEDA